MSFNNIEIQVPYTQKGLQEASIFTKYRNIRQHAVTCMAWVKSSITISTFIIPVQRT